MNTLLLSVSSGNMSTAQMFSFFQNGRYQFQVCSQLKMGWCSWSNLDQHMPNTPIRPSRLQTGRRFDCLGKQSFSTTEVQNTWIHRNFCKIHWIQKLGKHLLAGNKCIIIWKSNHWHICPQFLLKKNLSMSTKSSISTCYSFLFFHLFCYLLVSK